MNRAGGQHKPQVIPWPGIPPPAHHVTIDMRMTDSPDSACEPDVLLQNVSPIIKGNIIKAQSALQEVQVRPASPFVPPPPPPPPPTNGFHTPNTAWTQLIDSDGDSGIMRLGSTSSSETDHSSLGFPDNYLSKLQVKHFTWIPSKPSTPLSSYTTPIRGDHTIAASVPKHPNHQSSRIPSAGFNSHQNHRTDTSHHSDTNQPRPLSWQRQKSMSVADVRRIQNCNTPTNVQPASSRPLSLVGYPVDTPAQSRNPVRCSCHTACVHCGTKFASRNFLRSTSDIPSGLCVTTSSKCEVPQTKPSMSMDVYERLIRKETDLVFSGYDMIKVHARPASVIPESISHRGLTPRQAKSADAAARQWRLKKAYSMTSALDSEEFVKAHASVVSVIPTALGRGNTKCTNLSSMRPPVRPMTPLMPVKLAVDTVLPTPKAMHVVSSNYNAINQNPLRNDEEIEDDCPPPPSASQTAVTYAKVNKLQKPVKSSKGKHPCSEVLVTDDNEPPLPPRNYRSVNGSKGELHNSFAGKVQDFTRSAKDAIRKAFGLDCNNEDQIVTRNGRKSQRNSKPISPAIPNV